jgi:hypothetical protein
MLSVFSIVPNGPIDQFDCIVFVKYSYMWCTVFSHIFSGWVKVGKMRYTENRLPRPKSSILLRRAIDSAANRNKVRKTQFVTKCDEALLKDYQVKNI